MIKFCVGDYILKPLTLEDKHVMDSYLHALKTGISDYSFAANYMWFSNVSGFYSIVNNCFSLFILQSDKLTMLLPPIGEKRFINDALAQCFEIMNTVNKDVAASRIEYVYEEFLSDFASDHTNQSDTFEVFQDYVAHKRLADYLYNTDDLINLSGNSYSSKRNEINKFNKTYQNVKVEILDPVLHRDECIYLNRKWIASRMQHMPKEGSEAFIDNISYERFALKRIFESYEELQLFGIILRIDGEISGFTIGEKLDDDIASIMIEKSDFEKPGSAQYIFREFCRALKEEYGCRYINAGDDMGFENMKKVKMSYRPTRLVPKYSISQKAI